MIPAKQESCFIRNVIGICLFFFLLAESSIAQDDISSSYYDEIRAEKVAAQTSAFNLRGAVKSVTEVNFDYQDTTSREFNEQGLITRFSTTGKNGQRMYAESSEYFYEGNTLVRVLSRSAVFKEQVEKYFNKSGYLEKEIRDWTDNTEKFRREGKFVYSNSFRELKISYDYGKLDYNWDLVRSKEYLFTFDSLKRLTIVREKEVHDEATYGSTQSMAYDPSTGKLKYVSFRDDCAGSNSCLILDMSLDYDSRGNLINKSQLDATVRNATWHKSYVYIARYNEWNDITEEYMKMNIDDLRPIPYFTGKSAPGKPEIPSDYDKNKKVYLYDYDNHENWIMKYEMREGKPELIAWRSIKYYR